MGFFPYLLKVQNARKRLTKKDFKENEVEIKQQFLGEEMEWECFWEGLAIC